MSWKVEVVADNSRQWVGNLLRFATRDEADAYAEDLMYRWTAVRGWRVVESGDLVNYVWADSRAEPLKLDDK